MGVVNGGSITEYRDKGDAALPFDGPAALRLLQSQMQPLFYDPDRQDEAVARVARRGRRSRARSFALLPLVDVRNAHTLAGMLALCFNDNRKIAQDDTEALGLFATQVGYLLTIATELQRNRREAAQRLEAETKNRVKRVQEETKETVIRSVLHTVGNTAWTFQGRAGELMEEADRLGLDPTFRDKLALVEGASAQLGRSMEELQEQLTRSETAEALPLRETVADVVATARLDGLGKAVLRPLAWQHHLLEQAAALDPPITVEDKKAQRVASVGLTHAGRHAAAADQVVDAARTVHQGVGLHSEPDTDPNGVTGVLGYRTSTVHPKVDERPVRLALQHLADRAASARQEQAPEQDQPASRSQAAGGSQGGQPTVHLETDLGDAA